MINARIERYRSPSECIWKSSKLPVNRNDLFVYEKECKCWILWCRCEAQNPWRLIKGRLLLKFDQKISADCWLFSYQDRWRYKLIYRHRLIENRWFLRKITKSCTSKLQSSKKFQLKALHATGTKYIVSTPYLLYKSKCMSAHIHIRDTGVSTI